MVTAAVDGPVGAVHCRATRLHLSDRGVTSSDSSDCDDDHGQV